ncbi:FG-GAP-like repeat-containing protein [Asanoa sp. WMMD1127]|uniref:LamG-like jellyroll fold domain-containing protein n=1 Tax=Asanoa sp. WMMD1127 TaxID=3016107 RepID=UPI00241620FF|nr:LamG-like jellyroll fold domain-containing protein [Asanoa sp. WMMD1127]MDG4825039.1 FG-GAP-like repeat-containing protein [Asanoa sp. WMMD1127]
MAGFRKLRGSGRRLGALGSALLVTGLLAGPAPAASAARGGPACAAEAVDPAAAVALAAACDRRVEVRSARTETTRVFADPDGSGVVEQYAQPQRVRRADASWVALDTTLTTTKDGLLVPKAAAVDVSFSGGGAGPLVRARRDGHEVSLTWPAGPLPKPRIEGASAVYPDVHPGVDLVVTALKTGFREVLVVKNRAAAADPALRRVTFGTALRGLRWDRTGDGMAAVDKDGRAVLAASGPRMWDSAADDGAAAADGSRAHSSTDRPALGARNAAMPVTIDGGTLAFTPDLGLLADPATVYPVYLDPTVTYSSWTMINSRHSSQSYWSYDKKDCPGNYTGECAKVGYTDSGTTMTYRSMWQFPTSSFRGKQILDAQFSIDLLYSWECAKSTTELRTVSSTLSSGTTWSNTAGRWSGSNAATVSNESCDGARTPTEFAIKSLITGIAAGSATYTTLGLKAATESSHAGWKKFDADTARLVVSTNTVPGVPTAVTVDNKACATGAGRPFTSTATPSLRARVQDGDGNSLTASFEWARVRSNGSYGPTSDPRTQSRVASGSTALVTLPAGVLDKGDQLVGTGDWDADGAPDVIVRDPNGYLYLLPAKGSTLTSRVLIGTGWSPYTFAGIVDWDGDGHRDIVARDSAGVLWLYPGQSTRSAPGIPRVQIGDGWSSWTFAGITDWDRDSHQDLVARDSAGLLWLFPGRGGRAAIVAADRVQLGTGWANWTFQGTIDWDRDGNPDVVAKDSTGNQFLYVGNGRRAAFTPYVRYQIGSGWTSYTALTTSDMNADGKADLVAHNGITNWYGYPGSGGHTVGGARWTVGSVGISDGVYAFRAKATDAYAPGGYSGWCEFEVDQTNPFPPSITSDVYHSDPADCPAQGCGSVGQTGRFTFGSGSPDVVSYKWGFSDPPSTTVSPAAPGGSVTVEWTPPTGGSKTLYVHAVDRAGRFAPQVHQFVVAPPTPALARWLLNEPTGEAALADDTGNGHALLAHGTPTAGPSRIIDPITTALRFDGVDDYAATGTPVLADSSRSFTVIGWARLGDKTANRTVISQAGANTSAFLLEYEKTQDVWKFTTTSADVNLPTYRAAMSPGGAPRVGVWTHLAGVYDSASGEAKLYVDGVLVSTAAGVTTWDADRETRVGGFSPAQWAGSLAEVQVWDRVVSAAEVAELVDPVSRSLIGRWDLEDVGPGPSFDGSNYGHDLSFRGGAKIPPSGSGHTGTGLLLDGVDDYAETDGPVLQTDQSFTISAWAYLPTGVTGNRTVVAQRGAVESGVFLKYEASNGAWNCTYGDVDNTTGTGTVAASTGAASKGVWTQLTCVYDAQARTLTLYVNKALQRTVGVPNPWHANGPLMLGRLQWRAGMIEHWSGSVDEVRVYQGVIRDLTRIP